MARRDAAVGRARSFLVVLALLALAPVASAQGYKLVAHPTNPESSLSKTEVSRIFLKKVTAWSDGTKAVPVDQDLASGVRIAFSEDVHHRSPSAIVAYWQKQIFSGRSVPPVVKESDAQVIAYVSSNPGAVGYVSAGASTQGTKVLQVR